MTDLEQAETCNDSEIKMYWMGGSRIKTGQREGKGGERGWNLRRAKTTECEKIFHLSNNTKKCLSTVYAEVRVRASCN